MMKQTAKNRKYVWIFIVMIVSALCAGYLADYYHADTQAIEVFLQQNSVDYTTLDGMLVWEVDDATSGFIFYPGGKVEHTAYIPLMSELSSRGILCVLVEMPFRLAVFDVDGAAGIQENYPEIVNWYIGGHSLGGSIAATYLSDCDETYEGLILLGSYSSTDLSEKDLTVLSIYGSEDKVMNMDNYETMKENLPDDYQEIIIDGGCHAYFGMYGPQSNDGSPSISNIEQIVLTADLIESMISQK